MTIRIRFDITWTVTPAASGRFSSSEDFLDLARGIFVEAFQAQNATLRSRVKPLADGRQEIQLLWDIDLARQTDAHLKSPSDHIALLKGGLAGGLEISVWRKADESEAIDHLEILDFYGHEAETEDYPVFRPEPHPEWEAADEVWLQDGCWFWAVSKERAAAINLDPFEGRGPSAGPDPEAIYTPWEDDYLARHSALQARNQALTQRLAALHAAA